MLRALVRATETSPAGFREIDVPQIRDEVPWR
jgi:hypothetical protein